MPQPATAHRAPTDPPAQAVDARQQPAAVEGRSATQLLEDYISRFEREKSVAPPAQEGTVHYEHMDPLQRYLLSASAPAQGAKPATRASISTRSSQAPLASLESVLSPSAASVVSSRSSAKDLSLGSRAHSLGSPASSLTSAAPLSSAASDADSARGQRAGAARLAPVREEVAVAAAPAAADVSTDASVSSEGNENVAPNVSRWSGAGKRGNSREALRELLDEFRSGADSSAVKVDRPRSLGEALASPPPRYERPESPDSEPPFSPAPLQVVQPRRLSPPSPGAASGGRSAGGSPWSVEGVAPGPARAAVDVLSSLLGMLSHHQSPVSPAPRPAGGSPGVEGGGGGGGGGVSVSFGELQSGSHRTPDASMLSDALAEALAAERSPPPPRTAPGSRSRPAPPRLPRPLAPAPPRVGPRGGRLPALRPAARGRGGRPRLLLRPPRGLGRPGAAAAAGAAPPRAPAASAGGADAVSTAAAAGPGRGGAAALARFDRWRGRIHEPRLPRRPARLGRHRRAPRQHAAPPAVAAGQRPRTPPPSVGTAVVRMPRFKETAAQAAARAAAAAGPGPVPGHRPSAPRIKSPSAGSAPEAPTPPPPVVLPAAAIGGAPAAAAEEEAEEEEGVSGAALLGSALSAALARVRSVLERTGECSVLDDPLLLSSSGLLHDTAPPARPRPRPWTPPPPRPPHPPSRPPRPPQLRRRRRRGLQGRSERAGRRRRAPGGACRRAAAAAGGAAGRERPVDGGVPPRGDPAPARFVPRPLRSPRRRLGEGSATASRAPASSCSLSVAESGGSSERGGAGAGGCRGGPWRGGAAESVASSGPSAPRPPPASPPPRPATPPPRPPGALRPPHGAGAGAGRRQPGAVGGNSKARGPPGGARAPRRSPSAPPPRSAAGPPARRRARAPGPPSGPPAAAAGAEPAAGAGGSRALLREGRGGAGAREAEQAPRAEARRRRLEVRVPAAGESPERAREDEGCAEPAAGDSARPVRIARPAPEPATAPAPSLVQVYVCGPNGPHAAAPAAAPPAVFRAPPRAPPGDAGAAGAAAEAAGPFALLAALRHLDALKTLVRRGPAEAS
eukprot:tig00000388_g24805.t1